MELDDQRGLGVGKHLFLAEDREIGSLSIKVFARLLQAVGGIPVVLLIVILCTMFVSISLSNLYLSVSWGEAYKKGEDTTSLVNFIIVLSVFSGIVAGTRTLIFLTKGAKVSQLVHSKMTFQILRASLSDYLQRVPFGQLLNRFSFDIDIIDKRVFEYVSYACVLFFMFLFDLGSLISGAKHLGFIAPCIIFLFLGFWYRGRYMNAKREFMRLYSITKSPISGWAESIVKGSTVLRAMNREKSCLAKMNFMIEENTKNGIIAFGLDYWFMQRLQLCSFFIVLLPCYAYVIYQFAFTNETIQYGLLIIFIQSSSRLVRDYQTFVRFFSELENSLIALERCKKFEDIQPEENYMNLEQDRKVYENPKNRKKFDRRDIETWGKDILFKKGRIEIRDVTAKYPSRPEPVLKSISVVIEPGTKVGVVGRTGAGKSSFIKLFSRVMIPDEGSILIDGHDISKMDLRVLRNQIGILSQNVCLFELSLLQNIDPYIKENKKKKEDSNEEGKAGRSQNQLKILERWIKELGIENPEFVKDGIKMKLHANGDNLSQGEKQIVSFARALNKKRSVIIFDEATSSLDQETEKLFQKKVKEHFKDSTMLIIAHRLQTVMDCDKIMVFDAGKIVEYDTPSILKADRTTLFSKLCEKM